MFRGALYMYVAERLENVVNGFLIKLYFEIINVPYVRSKGEIAFELFKN